MSSDSRRTLNNIVFYFWNSAVEIRKDLRLLAVWWSSSRLKNLQPRDTWRTPSLGKEEKQSKWEGIKSQKRKYFSNSFFASSSLTLVPSFYLQQDMDWFSLVRVVFVLVQIQHLGYSLFNPSTLECAYWQCTKVPWLFWQAHISYASRPKQQR